MQGKVAFLIKCGRSQEPGEKDLERDFAGHTRQKSFTEEVVNKQIKHA